MEDSLLPSCNGPVQVGALGQRTRVSCSPLPLSDCSCLFAVWSCVEAPVVGQALGLGTVQAWQRLPQP